MGGACSSHVGNKRNAHSVLVGKPEGKRPLGSPRRRWEDNIRMAGCCKHANEPSGSIRGCIYKFLD
jgi:hypothetical protein